MDPGLNQAVFETIHFHFFLFWVTSVLLDPDLDPTDQNQCGSGSTSILLKGVTKLSLQAVLVRYRTYSTNGKRTYDTYADIICVAIL